MLHGRTVYAGLTDGDINHESVLRVAKTNSLSVVCRVLLNVADAVAVGFKEQVIASNV